MTTVDDTARSDLEVATPSAVRLNNFSSERRIDSAGPMAHAADDEASAGANVSNSGGPFLSGNGSVSSHSDHTLRNDSKDLEAQQKSSVSSEKPLPSSQAAGPAALGADDPFLVTLKGREHLDPHTWSEPWRWVITGFAGLLVLNAAFASSAPSNLIPSIIRHYNVSEEVGVLLISIFVAGYCVGPILWGPLSERYGRRLVMFIAWGPYVAFQVGCALAPNIGSLIVFRFLGGCFAAAPLTNSGGVIADLWGPDKRGDALAFFSLMPFAGPALAPIISGFMEVTKTNFRWIFWVLTIFAGVCFVFISPLLPETYVPYLLHLEAKRLRKETGDDRWHAPMDNKKETTKELLDRTIYKPFRMAAQEPMLLLLTIYMSLVYGVVYLLFEAVPIIFERQHGLNPGESGLVFLALLGGGVAAVFGYVLYFNPKYTAYHHSLNGKPVPPEFRLKPLMFAAPLFAVSFFWVGWTSYPSINIASPILGIFLLGITILYIFLGIFNYLIDTYLMNAASALSFNTVCRSSFGAAFPLFAIQMFKKLGVPGASSLLGGLAILFIPAPFLLYKYGKKFRMMSKNAIVRPNED
ncbi:BQ5605_C027g10369 [Microbotryum silenes-dioicae]|uniref:BQ5605_C027g10369 protein n=1 Tax=Microbotryum silenes-dioicae TaxID=796604 RepID=A0A2X0PGQ1_9BASI|nr:BQ5605_C027g10369 [Microbotryum silenes-dioicae]